MFRAKHPSILVPLIFILSCSYQEWANEKNLKDAIQEDLDSISKDFRSSILALGLEEFAEVTISPRGMTVTIKSDFAFESGTSILRAEVKPLLDAITPTMIYRGEKRVYPVVVEGHTDHTPTNPELAQIYPTNWEYSSALAAAVVRYLIGNAVQGSMLRAVGVAYMLPYGTPFTEFMHGVISYSVILERNATSDLREKNRRVEIIFEGWHQIH